MPSVINLRRKEYSECKCEEIIEKLPKLKKYLCEDHIIVSDQEYKGAGYKIFSGNFRYMESKWTAKARFRPELEQNKNKITRSLVDSIDKAFFKFVARKHNIPGRIKKEGNSWIVVRNDKRERE